MYIHVTTYDTYNIASNIICGLCNTQEETIKHSWSAYMEHLWNSISNGFENANLKLNITYQVALFLNTREQNQNNITVQARNDIFIVTKHYIFQAK